MYTLQKNKGNLIDTKFFELPLGTIKPNGWLKNQLQIQKNGLTGHIDEIWPDLGELSGWLGSSGENWERGPYYLDGLVPLAYLLDDEEMIAKSKKWIEWTLNSQMENGFFGPTINNDWWPRMVMLKVLTQYYEATFDERVLEFMSKYFYHLNSELEKRPLIDWGRSRSADQIYSVIWLYNITQDEILIELCHKLKQQSYDWVGFLANLPYTHPSEKYYPWSQIINLHFRYYYKLMDDYSNHTVNVAMGIKQPYIYSQFCDQENYLEIGRVGINSLLKHHGQPINIWSGDEHLNGVSPFQGIELCSVNEYAFSLETAIKVDNDVRLSDDLESMIYNGLFGTISDDYNLHQYDQLANQIACTRNATHYYNNGPAANTFGLQPNFGCCAANMHQGLPKFISHMWYGTNDDGLVQVAYGPNLLTTSINGSSVQITTDTNYPFDGKINYSVRTSKPLKLPLRFKIPKWCENFQCSVDYHIDGEYIYIDEHINDELKFSIDFDMNVRLELNYDGNYVIKRGPLLYSLNLSEEWQAFTNVSPHADYEVFTTDEWRFALDSNCIQSAVVTLNEMEYQPFNKIIPGAKITLDAHLIDWDFDGTVAAKVPTNPISKGKRKIELVPYGATKLRLTVFAKIQ